jgi:hypothetical protein
MSAGPAISDAILFPGVAGVVAPFISSLTPARSQATDTIVSSMVPALDGLLRRLPKSSRSIRRG